MEISAIDKEHIEYLNKITNLEWRVAYSFKYYYVYCDGSATGSDGKGLSKDARKKMDIISKLGMRPYGSWQHYKGDHIFVKKDEVLAHKLNAVNR